MIIASGPPDLSEQLRALEQEFPGWHAWHSDAGIFYATTCKCAYECGSGTTVEAPTPELLRYEIACQVHQWQIADVAAVNNLRAEVVEGLRQLAGRLEADESTPLPANCWPLTFRAPESVSDAAGLARLAASLGVEDGRLQEDGCSARVRGHVGGVPVEITADITARLLDPLDPDPSVIRRTYSHGAYPLAVAS
jgi:hypothetical protein